MRQDGVGDSNTFIFSDVAVRNDGGLVGTDAEVGKSSELLPFFGPKQLALHIARFMLDDVPADGFEFHELFLQGWQSVGFAVLTVFLFCFSRRAACVFEPPWMLLFDL